jgi:hypothetical protein
MDNDIVNNIHNLLKEHHEKNPNLAFNPEDLRKLGLNLASEILKLPKEAHILAWNIVGSTFAESAPGKMYEFFAETGIEMAKGSITVLNTPEDRNNFITGFSLYNTFVPEEPNNNSNKKVKP